MIRVINKFFGISILLVNTAFCQPKPDLSKQVEFINQQLQEQKLWLIRQEPKNSVLYQMKYMPKENSRNISSRQPYFQQPAWSGFEHSNRFESPIQKNDLSGLQHFMQYDRTQYLQSIKNSWWKDPSKGIGASLLQGFVNDRYPGKKF